MAMTLDGTSGITQLTGSIVMSGSTSGTVTIIPTATAGSNTATLPAATGTVMVSGNMPAFSAYANANLNLSNDTWTKVLFQTEEFDTNSNFASSRFTPTIAGYYQLSSGIYMTAVGGNLQLWALYKNGSSYKRFGYTPFSATVFMLTGSSLVYANGTTDYFEMYVYQNFSTSGAVTYGQDYCWFNGSMVRGA